MRRALAVTVAAMVALALTGCGGRTGLGYFSDTDGGFGPPDASAHDATIPDGARVDAAPDDASAPADASPGRDASLGKSCAEIMLCVFQAGQDYQAMLACTTGASVSGLTQAGGIIMCLAQNCNQMFLTDGGGGQLDLLMCLVNSCESQLCACDGLTTALPPGILFCPEG